MGSSEPHVIFRCNFLYIPARIEAPSTFSWDMQLPIH